MRRGLADLFESTPQHGPIDTSSKHRALPGVNGGPRRGKALPPPLLRSLSRKRETQDIKKVSIYLYMKKGLYIHHKGLYISTLSICMSPTEPCSKLDVNPSNVNPIIFIRCAIFHRCCSLFNCNTRTLPSSRCRASLAHLRQSRPDSGLDLLANVLETV